MAKESKLEKLLRLATVDVRGFQRVERGRVQQVHPHVETRAQEAAQNGWIPQPDWQKGQGEYVAKGEAAWKGKDWARGAADLKGRSEASVKAHDSASRTASADARADIAADRAARQASRGSGVNLRSQAQRMANRRARRTSVDSARPSGTLQDRVEQMEQDRQATSSRVENHPLFNAPAPAGTPAEQLIHDAATRAIQEAALQTGAIDQNGLSHVMQEMASVEARLTSEHAHGRNETVAVEQRISHDMHEEARARLALNLLGILAGILLIAVTGGAGAIIGEVMAFGWTAEVARELATYHGVESGKHPGARKVLAHPLGSAVSGAKAVASRKPVQPTGSAAAKATPHAIKAPLKPK